MSKPEILVTNGSLPAVLEGLESDFTLRHYWSAENPDQFLDAHVDTIRGVVAGGHINIDAAFIDRCPKLEIVSNFGVGYDSIDAGYAAEKGVIVTNTPDVLTEEVADTAIGLAIMTVRELGAAERWLRAGKWADEGDFPLTTGTLRGKTMGILGLGRIGQAVARRAEAMGLKIAYHGRKKQAVDYTYFDTLAGLAENSDILVCIMPGGEATHHMVSAEIFSALGPEGYFINIGRGSSVDEAALIAALKSNTICAAGLDVFENEPHVPADLIALENTVLLPHVGSGTVHTRRAMGQLVVDNIKNWFENGAPVTPVAETPWPRS
ncbi:MAG: 2-hydroxyacid dehydrogenase [Stappiaceae bacterium]